MWFSPQGAVVAAGDHDVVLVDGQGIHDGARLLQHVVQELALQQDPAQTSAGGALLYAQTPLPLDIM